jgi:hypothetical protein
MLDRTELPATTAASAQLAVAAVLGPPPLAEGEDAAAYDELLARISSTVRPADILEEIWTRDVADLVWEGFRLRRLKARFLTHCRRDGLSETLSRLLVGSPNEIVKQWIARDRAAIETVDAALAAAGLTMEGVAAWSLMRRITDLERIERMLTAAEARRHLALRELDRHRATLARTLRRAVAAVEEAGLEVITPDKPAPEAVA